MAKRILAVDPGNEFSAYVVYDTETKQIGEFGKHENSYVLGRMWKFMEECECMAIEMPACYGMAVGKTVFDTCRWVGIFQQAFHDGANKPAWLVYRKAPNKADGIEGVCMHICKNNRANDSNIRRAILDRYPATGGGKTPQVGTKSQPGPLYGVKADIWAALAVAITFAESKGL